MSLKCKGLFVIGAKRTPFCKYGGSLRELPASHAFAAAAKDAIRSSGVDPHNIDNTVVGNVNFLSQCDGGKTPRYCGTYSGLPLEKPALGVNKACATGIQAVITSAVDIITGAAKISLTGGTEIMSALPHLVRNARFGTTFGIDYNFVDHLETELVDSYSGKSIQRMAEELAKKHGISEEYADEFAINSYSKWKAAQDSKLFKDEIASLTVTLKNKEILVEKDEIANPALTAAEIRKAPALIKEGYIINKLNSSAPADGASALILASEHAIKAHQLTPLARISGWACVGVDPQDFGTGALTAVKRILNDHKLNADDVDLFGHAANLLQKFVLPCITRNDHKLNADDVDLFEINETFAPEVILTMKELNLDPDKVNISGGALIMGHPAAATGARMVTHLVHQIRYSARGVLETAVTRDFVHVDSALYIEGGPSTGIQYKAEYPVFNQERQI